MNHSVMSVGGFRGIARSLLQCALWVLLVSCVSPARDSPDILHIEKEYQVIRKALPSMTTESRRYMGPDGGIYKLSVYRDATGAVRMSKFEASDPTHRHIQEHYHAGGVLIFALYQFWRYPGLFDYTRRADRYYFIGGRMIRWLNHDKDWVHADSEAFRKAEKEVVEFAELLEAGSKVWPPDFP